MKFFKKEMKFISALVFTNCPHRNVDRVMCHFKPHQRVTIEEYMLKIIAVDLMDDASDYADLSKDIQNDVEKICDLIYSANIVQKVKKKFWI